MNKLLNFGLTDRPQKAESEKGCDFWCCFIKIIRAHVSIALGQTKPCVIRCCVIITDPSQPTTSAANFATILTSEFRDVQPQSNRLYCKAPMTRHRNIGIRITAQIQLRICAVNNFIRYQAIGFKGGTKNLQT